MFALTDLAATLRVFNCRLTTAMETLSEKTKAFDADLDRLATYDKQAAQWLQTALARDASLTLIAHRNDWKQRDR